MLTRELAALPVASFRATQEASMVSPSPDASPAPASPAAPPNGGTTDAPADSAPAVSPITPPAAPTTTIERPPPSPVAGLPPAGQDAPTETESTPASTAPLELTTAPPAPTEDGAPLPIQPVEEVSPGPASSGSPGSAGGDRPIRGTSSGAYDLSAFAERASEADAAAAAARGQARRAAAAKGKAKKGGASEVAPAAGESMRQPTTIKDHAAVQSRAVSAAVPPAARATPPLPVPDLTSNIVPEYEPPVEVPSVVVPFSDATDRPLRPAASSAMLADTDGEDATATSTAGSADAFASIPLSERVGHKVAAARRSGYLAIAAALAPDASSADATAAHAVVADGGLDLLKKAVSEGTPLPLDAGVLMLRAVLATQAGQSLARAHVNELLAALQARSFASSKPSTCDAAADCAAALITAAADVRAMLSTFSNSLKTLKGPARKAVPTTCKAIAKHLLKSPNMVDLSSLLTVLPPLLGVGSDRAILAAAVDLSRVLHVIACSEIEALLERHGGPSGITTETVDAIRDHQGYAAQIHASMTAAGVDLTSLTASGGGAAASSVAANINTISAEELADMNTDAAYAAASEAVELSPAALKDVKLADVPKAAWREKVEAIARFMTVISKHARVSLAPGSDLVGMLSRTLQEPNAVAFARAAEALAALAARMHERFTVHARHVLPHFIDKLKEKRGAAGAAAQHALRVFVRVNALSLEALVEELRPVITNSKSVEQRSNALDVLLSIVASPRVLPTDVLSGPANRERLSSISTLCYDACASEPSLDVKHIAERALGCLLSRMSTPEKPSTQHAVLAPLLARLEDANKASADRVRVAAGLLEASTVAATVMNIKPTSAAGVPPPATAGSATARGASARAPSRARSNSIASTASTSSLPAVSAAPAAAKARARTASGAAATRDTPDEASMPSTPPVMTPDDALTALAEGIIPGFAVAQLAGLDSKAIPDKRGAIDALVAAASADPAEVGSRIELVAVLLAVKTNNFKALSNPAILSGVVCGLERLARACVDPHRMPRSVAVFLIEQLSAFLKEKKGGAEVTALLLAIAYAVGPAFVAHHVCTVAAASKVQAVQAACNEFLASLITKFGAVRVAPATTAAHLASDVGVQSNAVVVRGAASTALGVMHRHMGKALITLLGSRKLNVPDKVLEAVAASAPYTHEDAVALWAATEAPYGEERPPPAPGAPAAIAGTVAVAEVGASASSDRLDLSTLLPRSTLAQMEDESSGVPVVGEGSTAAVAAAAAASAADSDAGKPWQRRLDAFAAVTAALERVAVRAQLLAGNEFLSALIKVTAGRLKDTNANVRAAACTVLVRVARVTTAAQCSHFIKIVGDNLVACMNDKKTAVASACLEAMDALVADADAGGASSNTAVQSMFHIVATSRVLSTTATIRVQLLRWMVRYAPVLTLAVNIPVYHELVPGLVDCMLDKSPEPRKAVGELLPFLLRCMNAKRLKDIASSSVHKEAAREQVVEFIDKVAASIAPPAAAAASLRPPLGTTRGPSPAPAASTTAAGPRKVAAASVVRAASAPAAPDALLREKVAAYAIFPGDTKGRGHRASDKSVFRPWVDARSATSLWLDLAVAWRKGAYSTAPLADDMFGPDGKSVVDDRVIPPLMWMKQQYSYWSARGASSAASASAATPLDSLQHSFDLQLRYVALVLCIVGNNANVVKAATEYIEALFACAKVRPELPITRIDISTLVPVLLHAMEAAKALNRTLITSAMCHLIDGLPAQSDEDEHADSWLTLRGFMRNFMTREIKNADRAPYKAQLFVFVAYLVEKHTVGRLVLPENLLQIVLTQASESKDKAVADGCWAILERWFASPHHLHCSAESFFLKISRHIAVKKRDAFKTRVAAWLKERKMPAADWLRIEATIASDPIDAVGRMVAARETDDLELSVVIPDEEMHSALEMQSSSAAGVPIEQDIMADAVPPPRGRGYNSPENMKENDSAASGISLGASGVGPLSERSLDAAPAPPTTKKAAAAALAASSVVTPSQRAQRMLDDMDLPVELGTSSAQLATALASCHVSIATPLLSCWDYIRRRPGHELHDLSVVKAHLTELRAALRTDDVAGVNAIPDADVQVSLCRDVNVILAACVMLQYLACGQSYSRSKSDKQHSVIDVKCLWELNECIFDVVRNQSAARCVNVVTADMLITELLMRSLDKRLVAAGDSGMQLHHLMSRLIMRILWNVPKESSCVAILRMLRRLATGAPFVACSNIRAVDSQTVANTCQLLLRLALYETDTWMASKSDASAAATARGNGWAGINVTLVVAAVDHVLNEAAIHARVEPLLWVPHGDAVSAASLAAVHQDAMLRGSPASRIHDLASSPRTTDSSTRAYTHPRFTFPIEPRSSNPIVAYGSAMGIADSHAFQALQPVLSIAEFLCEMAHPFAGGMLGHMDAADVPSHSISRKIFDAEMQRMALLTGVPVAEVLPSNACHSRMLEQMKGSSTSGPAASTPAVTRMSSKAAFAVTPAAESIDPRARALLAATQQRTSPLTPPVRLTTLEPARSGDVESPLASMDFKVTAGAATPMPTRHASARVPASAQSGSLVRSAAVGASVNDAIASLRSATRDTWATVAKDLVDACARAKVEDGFEVLTRAEACLNAPRMSTLLSKILHYASTCGDEHVMTQPIVKAAKARLNAAMARPSSGAVSADMLAPPAAAVEPFADTTMRPPVKKRLSGISAGVGPRKHAASAAAAALDSTSAEI